MSQQTSQFRGLDPKPVPPQGSKIIGQHADGRPIYELTERVQTGRKPRLINGEEQWRKNRATGVPQNQVFDPIHGTKTRVFVLEPCKNGNVIINENFRQNPADELAQRRREEVAAFHNELAEKAVERGLSPDDVLDKLMEVATS